MAGKFTENLQSSNEVDDCLLKAASLTDKEILDSVRRTEDQEQGDEEDGKVLSLTPRCLNIARCE